MCVFEAKAGMSITVEHCTVFTSIGFRERAHRFGKNSNVFRDEKWAERIFQWPIAGSVPERQIALFARGCETTDRSNQKRIRYNPRRPESSLDNLILKERTMKCEKQRQNWQKSRFNLFANRGKTLVSICWRLIASRTDSSRNGRLSAPPPHRRSRLNAKIGGGVFDLVAITIMARLVGAAKIIW
jgi:hypothetical protein